MRTTPVRPRVGDAAPAVSAVGPAGHPWKLDDHRGRVLVLIFHRHIH